MEMSIKNKAPFMPTKQLLTTMNEDLEALESIYQCGLAQERISNDVLSLGRIQLGESTETQNDPGAELTLTDMFRMFCFLDIADVH